MKAEKTTEQIGFLIPTELESQNLETNTGLIYAGHGPGKCAACSAAAELIFQRGCDTVILWGTAGSRTRRQGEIIVAAAAAHFDFDISPLLGCTQIGQVPGIADSPWMRTDAGLTDRLPAILTALFPGHPVSCGRICTGDAFIEYTAGRPLNPIEAAADAFDMESAALVHFCRNLEKPVRTAVIRVISNSVLHDAHTDFAGFLQTFGEMNRQLGKLQQALAAGGNRPQYQALPADILPEKSK